MSRHKHDPRGLVSLGDQIVEECSICRMRRVITIASGWRRRDRYSRWVKKEDAAKYMLSWLWPRAI